MTTGEPYDVAVIGAGVVGAAVARALLDFRLRVAVIDARDDVGDGTSKANTAILHTGFDARPGTLESRLIRRGRELLCDYAAQTGIPIERTGALLLAWTPEEAGALPALQAKAVANGYGACELVDASEVYRRVPDLAPGVLAGMTVPDESITCTWTATLALATDARRRGADLLLGHRVIARSADGDTTVLHTADGRDVAARWVVNAAGLGSDTIDRVFGFERFTVTPRRGELIVFDKLARPLAPLILLTVPSRMGKGMLISPTIYGNVMLGPTAEDMTDRAATGTSAAGIELLLDRGARLMPRLLDEEITATYAGVRAAIDADDYLIEADAAQRYVVAAGIRSTGLTSAMGVAEHIVDLLAGAGVPLPPRADVPPPPRMPNLGEAFPRPYQDADLIAADPEYGRIVCFCERVTAGEIRDALASTIAPAGLDGLRRRTRAMNGRCQGFYCGAAVAELLTAAGTA